MGSSGEMTRTAIGPGLWLTVVKDDAGRDLTVHIRIDLPHGQIREIYLDPRDMDAVAGFWIARQAKRKRERRRSGDGG